MKRSIIRIRSAIFLVLMISLVGACANIERGGEKSNGATPSASTPTFTYNSLSGRVGEDGRVLAVKIDDTEPARPQIGLADADVIYIEQVEGGVTRLAAIFSSRYPSRIGPIRSARISDMELLAQYGKVAFAFSGAQHKLRPVIESANLFNLGAEREGIAVYSRDHTRNGPYNMILNPQALFERADKRELEIVRAKKIGWSFKKKFSLGEKIVGAKMKWPATRYVISWSKTYSGWVIEQNGSSKVDASGVPSVASTFIAQLVSITDSEYGDKLGGRTPLVTTVGSGEAYIFRDGRVIPGRWSRASAESGTSFTSSDGSEIPLKAGQVWIALVGQAPEITYPVASAGTGSASPSPTK